MLATFHVSNTNDSGSGSFRQAVIDAFTLQNKDEIVFDPILFTSGTPVINLMSPLTVNDPVLLHSPNGRVVIQKGAGSTAENGLLVRPSLGSGLSDSFEISGLEIRNFKYGIRVTHGGGVVNSTVESVKISNIIFQSNEQGILLDDPRYPFEIRNNNIVGIPTVSVNLEAGIWIGTMSTASIFASEIDNNIIYGNEDYGIIASGAKVPNLVVTNNRIGADEFGAFNGNGIGIYLQGADLQNAEISQGNEIVSNATGILIVQTNGVLIEGNLIGYNTNNGIQLSTANDHEITVNDFIENGAAAIAIGGGLSDTSTHNRVSANYFQLNGGLPIDLASNGLIDANDPTDLDPGPNSLQNHPVIVESSVVDEGTHWRVPVQLDIRGPGNYRLEFYRYNPNSAVKSYSFIRAETRTLTATVDIDDLKEDFFFRQGVELTTSERLAVLVIREESPPPTVFNDTSEIYVASSSFVDNSNAPPKVRDVRLTGVLSDGSTNTLTPWSRSAYSFKQLSESGKQVDSLFTAGVNRIHIEFSEPLTVSANALSLIGTSGPISLQYEGLAGTVATWKIPAGIGADKYRLVLSSAGVTDAVGRQLAGEWDLPIANDDNLLGATDKGPDWNNDQVRSFAPGNVAPTNFRLHFAYLPGDYNQDGRVVAGETGGDGDGDGFSGGSGDAAVVTAAVSHGRTSLVAGRFQGDYSDNEIVDSASDYALWKATFGSTIDLRADGNGNGSVEAGDYTVWFDNLGGYSAWSKLSGAPGGGSGIPVFDPLNFPRVANVTISGSTSTHTPFSFNGPNDSTDFDGSGIQLTTVPVGAADTISITFTEDVNISADMLRLTGMRTANRPVLADFSYDLGTMTANWRFTGWTFGDHYAIALSDAVTDVEGNALDGEWTNPQTRATVNALVSEFPSGNGYAGGAFNFVATLLPGDADLNGLVNITDLVILQNHYQNGQLDELFSEADFNGDGQVNIGDLSMLSTNYGANLQTLSLLADLDGDWRVDDDDIGILATNVGAGNPTATQGDLDHDNDVDVHDLDRMFAQYGLELAVVS
jgi:hypothetical protein